MIAVTLSTAQEAPSFCQPSSFSCQCFFASSSSSNSKSKNWKSTQKGAVSPM